MIKKILTLLLFAVGFFVALIYTNGWFGFDAQKIMDSSKEQASNLFFEKNNLS